jgi:hypothetical protein
MREKLLDNLLRGKINQLQQIFSPRIRFHAQTKDQFSVITINGY